MFRTLSDRTTIKIRLSVAPLNRDRMQHTFFFSNIFQRKGQTGIFSFDDPDFAKGSFADDAEQTEMVEVD